jgi:hypothetical protein
MTPQWPLRFFDVKPVLASQCGRAIPARSPMPNQ